MPTSLLRHYFNEEFGNTVYVIEPKVILAQSIPLDIVSYSKDIKLGDNIGYLTGSYKVRATNRNKLIYMTTEIFRKQYSDYEHARMPNFVVDRFLSAEDSFGTVFLSFVGSTCSGYRGNTSVSQVLNSDLVS